MRCRSFITMTWSRHSRRMDPISRSTHGFCHGLRGAVLICSMPLADDPGAYHDGRRRQDHGDPAGRRLTAKASGRMLVGKAATGFSGGTIARMRSAWVIAASHGRHCVWFLDCLRPVYFDLARDHASGGGDVGDDQERLSRPGRAAVTM